MTEIRHDIVKQWMEDGAAEVPQGADLKVFPEYRDDIAGSHCLGRIRVLHMIDGGFFNSFFDISRFRVRSQALRQPFQHPIQDFKLFIGPLKTVRPDIFLGHQNTFLFKAFLGVLNDTFKVLDMMKGRPGKKDIIMIRLENRLIDVFLIKPDGVALLFNHCSAFFNPLFR